MKNKTKDTITQRIVDATKTDEQRIKEYEECRRKIETYDWKDKILHGKIKNIVIK